MLAEKNKRKELLQFIDQKTFDPILHLPVETYSGADRKNFESVRKEVLQEKRKLHACKSAGEIKETFLHRVNENPVQGRDHRQDIFGQLSMLPEVKARFMVLCRKLEI
ncbi:MAG TPA: hypothetical protein VKR53_19280 [Puia sp.]|nr:hypothetical protein [Puia sp.]